MPDVFTPQKRSEVMARIRGKGNRDTELALRSLLRANGIAGWRRHYPILGRPDFAFPREKVAIFVDGCFWHRCPRCSNLPANNREFWERKLTANVERDRRVTRVLRGQGWRVVRVWEHAMHEPSRTISRIRVALRVSGAQRPRRTVAP